MKRDGRKIVGVVAWDFQIAQIADRAGVEIVSVGDSVGINLRGHASPLEAAGAALLDFTHSGPVAGPAVVKAVSIPVLGGMGGGPWLDGRMRMAHAAIGYPAGALESTTPRYANVARITLDALTAYSEDV